MAYIGKKPFDIQQALASIDRFTGDGSTTTFDVTNSMPNGGDNDVTVVVDNVRQEPGASKSYTIGADGSGDIKRITFNVAPDDGSDIYVVNPGRPTSVIDVSDNTITTAKLQATSVTTAKIAADAITGAKLADDAVDSEHLVDGSVDNVHLAGSIANAKLANSSITINGTAVSLGGSITAGTDWQAVVVADGSTQLTAVAGRGYFLDTNLGTIDVNLPTSPNRGDTIVLADYGNNFATNRVIVNTGGKLIDSVVGGEPGSSGFAIDTNGAVVELVFADDTAGWIIKQNNAPSDLSADSYAEYIEATGGTITTSGNFKIHTFTGDGCFVVSKAGNNCGANTVDYIVVAGGGAGAGDVGGAGGAGGFRMSNSYGLPSPTTSPLASPTGITVTTQTYPISVGGGGSGNATTRGASGSNSVFSTITSAGGGGGAHRGACACAFAGGSGGGGAGESVTTPSTGTGGAGNTPPVSPSQGNAGGNGSTASQPRGSGGGGGAGAAGQSAAASNVAGDGGIGSFVSTSFAVGCAGTTGPVCATRYFAGGGGGGTEGSAPVGGAGTLGRGGAGGGGQSPSPTSGTGNGFAGTANTGGGGSGASRQNDNPPFGPRTGGAGGKGIVLIRYQFQSG